MIKIRRYAKYISSLEEENEKLKTENAELRSQVDFISTLPQEQLNDLVTLSLELEGTKGQDENAIKAAHVAKEKYEEEMKDIIELKKRCSYKWNQETNQ